MKNILIKNEDIPIYSFIFLINLIETFGKPKHIRKLIKAFKINATFIQKIKIITYQFSLN